MSENLNQHVNPDDKLNAGLQILSFCIPLAGGIMYFVYQKESPNKAKTACHAALWGIGAGVVMQIIGTLAGA